MFPRFSLIAWCACIVVVIVPVGWSYFLAPLFCLPCLWCASFVVVVVGVTACVHVVAVIVWLPLGMVRVIGFVLVLLVLRVSNVKV